jgi:transglutaminase-like putative cysteine protease
VNTSALSRESAAVATVAAFSITVALGFARVFSGWDFVGDMVVLTVVGHGVALGLRRMQVAVWAAIPIGAVVLVWTIVALYYPETMSWGLPTATTWELFTTELTAVREQFPTAVAPVVYAGGWDVLAAIGLAIAVLLGDTFAFRADARAEALVPGGVLFVFVGAIGDARLRVGLTALLVAVGVVTASVLRWYHATAGRRAGGVPLRRIWPAAIGLAVAVGIVAGVVGPRLPGAEADALYDTRGRAGGVTEVVSPLVDIRSRLTNRSNAELFEVDADFASYWRSSALPQFDGTTWGLPQRPLDELPEAAITPSSQALELRQRITIRGLDGSLVPAAPDPFQASGPSDLRWVAETSTLVTVDDRLDDGDVIDVVSAAPRFDPAVLAAATSNAAGDPIYTEVPDDLPGVVADTARQVAGGAQNTYEAARLLQSWFQQEFTYSLEVQSGHGNSAIEGFLRDRIGYCEQFAGTFAAMMRTLGTPARVAVGFTSGIESTPGTFVVQGRHAHAWPEVFFDGLGWVAFEPTPGRGAPGAESYTGLAEQQDEGGSTDGVGEADAVAPTTVPRAAIDRQFDPNVPSEFADPTLGSGSTEAAAPTGATDVGWIWYLVIALAAVAIAPAFVRLVRSRRTRNDVDHRLGRMWDQSVAALDRVGVPVAPSQTPAETAAATAVHFPMLSRPVALLAEAVTAAAYRPEGSAGFDVVGDYGSSTMRNCENWSRQIDRAVHDSASIAERVKRHFTDWG